MVTALRRPVRLGLAFAGLLVLAGLVRFEPARAQTAAARPADDVPRHAADAPRRLADAETVVSHVSTPDWKEASGRPTSTWCISRACRRRSR